jgi:hypothetical protein
MNMVVVIFWLFPTAGGWFFYWWNRYNARWDNFLVTVFSVNT